MAHKSQISTEEIKKILERHNFQFIRAEEAGQLTQTPFPIHVDAAEQDNDEWLNNSPAYFFFNSDVMSAAIIRMAARR